MSPTEALARVMFPRQWAKHDKWMEFAETWRNTLSEPEDMRRQYVLSCERSAGQEVAESLRQAEGVAVVDLPILEQMRELMKDPGP